MTPRQQRFVDEYLIDLNATQAAIRAGYAKKTADVQGPRLLGNVGVQAAIQKGKQKRSARTEITADKVLREIARLAFSDTRDYVTWGPHGVSLKPSSELNDDQAAAVAEVSETITESGGSKRFKLHSKQAALRDLAQHLGLIKEKHEHSGPNGEPLRAVILPDNGTGPRTD